MALMSGGSVSRATVGAFSVVEDMFRAIARATR
jgi:hypothetical protein